MIPHKKAEKALLAFLDRDHTPEQMLATLEVFFRACKQPQVADAIERNVKRVTGAK